MAKATAEKEQAKDKGRKEEGADGAAAKALLFNKKQLIILGSVLGVWTLLVGGIVWMVAGTGDGRADPGAGPEANAFGAVQEPLRGPIETVINEMHIPYMTMKETTPIVILSLALEFGKEWNEQQTDGAWRLHENFKYLRKKVTEDINPLIRSGIYNIIGARDINDLKGPRNKQFVEQLIRDEVNRLLMENGKMKEPPVKQAILTDYKFPE